jgi:hypothetical protein
MELAVVMAGKDAIWDRMVAKHGLVANRYGTCRRGRSATAVFSWNYDFFADLRRRQVIP